MYEPANTNISSSVVTPKPTAQASHAPSPLPGLESHCASTEQAAPMAPAAQLVGVHGAPLVGTVELRFTSLGLVNPLSYSAQYVSVRAVAAAPGDAICRGGLSSSTTGSA